MITSALSVSIDSSNLITTMTLLMIGILLATVYTVFIKKFRGEFVIALIDACAFDENTAKSPKELGFKMSFWRKLAVETSFFFSPDYISVGKEDVKYYVNEDAIPRLTSKYRDSGITFVHLILTFIAFLAVGLVMATIVPDLLNMFNF